MTEELLALSPLLVMVGLIVFGFLALGIATLGGWIGRQIEARQNRPAIEARAAAKRAEAERRLEEARIRRLELQLGMTDEAPKADQ